MSSIVHRSGLKLSHDENNLTTPKIALSTPEGSIYAGLKSHDHYKRKLPQWRYDLRRKLLPMIRWETPYLAWMQDRIRSPTLDSYFAITANLGTHTFFMTALPILFWCGYTQIGRSLAHVLMSGVFLTGFLKDLLSLPRPLSPPLQRINMSGSAALEYGFPSTHSANAVSAAVLFLLNISQAGTAIDPRTKFVLQILSYSYMFSIAFGRLYCGMHGFIDVLVGSFMGAVISFIEHYYGPAFQSYIHNGSWIGPVMVATIIFVLVRIHPEPADDCPCFDDSVAVAGVLVGVELGGWHYATQGWSWNVPSSATVPYNLSHLGWTVTVIRVMVGVGMIFGWRGVMKPLLLRVLPHLFRGLEGEGLVLPRKFFMPASEYKTVPDNLKVDNIMPTPSDLPALIASIRHPGRGRSVSIGPQSAADAHETLAYREKRRRDSRSAQVLISPPAPADSEQENDSYFSYAAQRLPSPSRGIVSSYEEMMGTGQVLFTPGLPKAAQDNGGQTINTFDQAELEEKDIFSQLTVPRMRYDVEVVTKLVVYTGIAWLAVEGNPIIFELIGLGMGGYVPS